MRALDNLFGLEVTLSDGVVETPASNLDLSRLGIALTSNLLWEPGTTVRIRFRLPGAGSAVARAIVRCLDGDVMELSVIASGPNFSRLLTQTFVASCQQAA